MALKEFFEKRKDKSRLEKELANSIGIAASTYYPKWYPGKVRDVTKDTDKVRGDLAIQMCEEAIKRGFQVTVIEGGSPESFWEELKKIGVQLRVTQTSNMSLRRREAFDTASKLKGVKYICYADPEKVSLVTDCITKGIQPLRNDEADMVILKRDEKAFKTYPEHQVFFEKKANALFNNLLRKHKLLPKDAEDLDAWFGPRLFTNEKRIVNLFLRKYEYQQGRGIEALNKITNLELWPNSIFLPLVNALHEGLRVTSVTVPYRHPKIQTENEQDNPDFRRKRDVQLKTIIKATMHLIRLFEENPKGKLRQANETSNDRQVAN